MTDDIERLRKELRDLRIAYAKDTDELEKELTVTKFQLAYWREIALENQAGAIPVTDDLTQRLKNWAIELYPKPYGACMEQAAEEIEYLVKELDKWKKLAIHNDQIAQIQAGIYPPIPHYED